MATRRIIVPRGTNGNVSFQVELDGVIYTLLFQYNRRADVWFFDLLQQDGTPIRRSIKVTTSFFWLRQVKRLLRPAGDLFALDTTQQALRTTFDELNERIALVYEEAPVA
jgi:hypothetical protein